MELTAPVAWAGRVRLGCALVPIPRLLSGATPQGATPRGLFDDGEHVLFPQDQILLVVQLDLGARVLAEEDLVAVLVHLPAPDRDDLALLGLLLRGVRDDDPALLDLFLLLPLDEDSVMQRTNLHSQRASR